MILWTKSICGGNLNHCRQWVCQLYNIQYNIRKSAYTWKCEYRQYLCWRSLEVSSHGSVNTHWSQRDRCTPFTSNHLSPVLEPVMSMLCLHKPASLEREKRLHFPWPNWCMTLPRRSTTQHSNYMSQICIGLCICACTPSHVPCALTAACTYTSLFWHRWIRGAD